MTQFTSLSLEDYLNKLSSDEPVPGGGSVSAYTASLAMGLTQMVGRISSKRKKKNLTPEEEKKDQQRRASIEGLVDSVEKIKRDAFRIVNLDPQVYEEVMKAYSQPDKMEDALDSSFRLQADLAFLIVLAREFNQTMMGLVSGSIKNDLLVAASLYEASFQGAYHTAMINVQYMKDAARKDKAVKAMDEVQKRFSSAPAPASA
jgi:formiminotetrahydrofolate cyclodeaminase